MIYMDSIVRKYLRILVVRMRRRMRDAKENGTFYGTKLGAMIIKREPYYYHEHTLMGSEIFRDNKKLNSAMVSMFLCFLREETTVHVTQSMMNELSRIYVNPYYLAEASYFCIKGDVMSKWKAHLIRLMETENRMMRNGNAIERFFNLKKPIVKPEIHIDA